jgi:ATP-dependent Clp protease adapter protein ClpS
MMKLTLIATLLSIMHMANAFAPATWGIRHKAVLFAGEKEGDSGGGAAIAKPAIKTEQKTVTRSKQKQKTTNEAKTFDPISRRDEEFEEAPMFKLMLVSDKSYDASHVVERMCAIVEGMDEDQASTVFQQASSTGKAMCGMYPFERAELFKEQLIRSDPMIYTDIVEENK